MGAFRYEFEMNIFLVFYLFLNIDCLRKISWQLIINFASVTRATQNNNKKNY